MAKNTILVNLILQIVFFIRAEVSWSIAAVLTRSVSIPRTPMKVRDSRAGSCFVYILMVNHLDFLRGAAEHGTTLTNAAVIGQRQHHRFEQKRKSKGFRLHVNICHPGRQRIQVLV